MDVAKLTAREEALTERLANTHDFREQPMMSAQNVEYEVSGRVNATAHGGVAAMHQLARRLGLVEALDRHVRLFKVYKPYHESDHIMNIALNILAGGTCLEDLELRRKDTAYLDALGATRIPDPTTAGDFLRRFTSEGDILRMQDGINVVRLGVWKRLPRKKRRRAIIDADGTIAPVTGECKQGIGLSYNGIWGYHPLIISLANTRETLYLVNRPGNRPSHDNAAIWMDRAVALTQGAYDEVWMRGDTDFSLTKNFDRWTDHGVKFVFGMDAMKPLLEKAEGLPLKGWKPLQRSPKYQLKTSPRERPENVKARIVYERGYKNLKLRKECVAEFSYRPGKCKQDYRVIVVRKNLSVERGEKKLYDEIRYFFYITNDTAMKPWAVVKFINGRCDHENDIEQLKNGIRAMRMPSGDLYSNWAYMVMATLAWNLKAWYGMLMPDRKTGAEIVRMEFRRFANGFMAIPAQVLRAARRIRVRLLAWTPYAEAFLSMFAWIRGLSPT